MNLICRVLLYGLLGVGLVGCGKPTEEPSGGASSQAPSVNLPAGSITVAQTRRVSPSFEYPAVVEALQKARVRAEISAVLRKIHFTPGQMVEEGQLLLEFDDAQYKASYEAARAEQQSAEAQTVKTQANWSRAEELLPKGYISQQDYDNSKASVDGARAAVARAKAGLEKAQIDLGNTSVYAPFSGKISKPNYAVGDFIIATSPSQPEPLFELVDMDPIYVVSSVELAGYYRFVLLRQKLEQRGEKVPDLVLQLKLSGGDMYPHKGTFVAWDNTSSSSSSTMSGRVLFPNPESLLLPGHNVTVMGESLASFNRVLIPQKSVQQDQQGYFVKVLDEQNVVQRRNVSLGIRYKDNWVVREGLEEGARVITSGAQMLRDGTKVELQ